MRSSFGVPIAAAARRPQEVSLLSPAVARASREAAGLDLLLAAERRHAQRVGGLAGGGAATLVGGAGLPAVLRVEVDVGVLGVSVTSRTPEELVHAQLHLPQMGMASSWAPPSRGQVHVELHGTQGVTLLRGAGWEGELSVGHVQAAAHAAATNHRRLRAATAAAAAAPAAAAGYALLLHPCSAPRWTTSCSPPRCPCCSRPPPPRATAAPAAARRARRGARGPAS
jgi:hypothetical protein